MGYTLFICLKLKIWLLICCWTFIFTFSLVGQSATWIPTKYLVQVGISIYDLHDLFVCVLFNAIISTLIRSFDSGDSTNHCSCIHQYEPLYSTILFLTEGLEPLTLWLCIWCSIEWAELGSLFCCPYHYFEPREVTETPTLDQLVGSHLKEEFTDLELALGSSLV